MKDFVVSVDVIDGYSKFVDESMKSNALSNSDQNDFVYSSDNNPQLKDDKQLKDDQEFKTIYCLGFVKLPWFRRKELTVSQSINSFKNKNLSLSMRMKKVLIDLID
jgi:hypothetical protein